MSPVELAITEAVVTEDLSPVAEAARLGLTATPKTLPPWLFYDRLGTQLFEQITALPEYYLTRTERALLEKHADEILAAFPEAVTIAELGAGTATKTGVLLAAATRSQSAVLYQPIDVSPTALEEARENLEAGCPGVVVHQQVVNYITEPIHIERPHQHRVLALYIGSSIGNFSPLEGISILSNLRRQLLPGDGLLLGTDLAPGATKPVAELLSAYDDAAGVTAAFNRNILVRLNRELGADFNLDGFEHQARWNPAESRMEMHLVSATGQSVTIPGNGLAASLRVDFAPGESIHTENSYKFTPESISALLEPGGFSTYRTFEDLDHRFAVTLARAV